MEKELSGIKTMLAQIHTTINGSPPQQILVSPAEHVAMETDPHNTQAQPAPDITAPPHRHGPALGSYRRASQTGGGGQVNPTVSLTGSVKPD